LADKLELPAFAATRCAAARLLLTTSPVDRYLLAWQQTRSGVARRVSGTETDGQTDGRTDGQTVSAAGAISAAN